MLESLHRADRAVMILKDALKDTSSKKTPAITQGLAHGAALLQLTSTDRRKFEDVLSTAQVPRGDRGG